MSQLLASRFQIHRLPACLEAIRRHYCDFGCAPSYGELAARIGVLKHQIPAMLERLSASGLIIWRRNAGPRAIRLPRPLSMYANSDLLWELQARGLVTTIAPGGVSAAISVWPHASAIDLAELPKDELDLLAQLDNIPGTRGDVLPR